MKYGMEEAMTQVLRRSDAVRRRRDRQLIRGLSGATVVLGSLLLAALGMLTRARLLAGAGEAYGAFLLSGAAGGYVLAGMLAFVCGVAFTLICAFVRLRRGTRSRDGTDRGAAVSPRGSPADQSTDDQHYYEEDMR